jgi:cobalt-zinc-cadmium efflux system membrane fusion protein
MTATCYSLAALALALAALSTGCGGHDEAAAAAPATTIGNDVLLTKDQIVQMKVVVDKVDLQDVDDTVLASGKVAFDDQKVLHVFSPVTGKAIKVIAQLGDHVKKGDPLAVIESPDIGQVTSDVGKAMAAVKAAETNYQRMKELLALKAVSELDYETAVNAYGQAKAELERAGQKAALFHSGDVVGQRYTLRSDIAGEVFYKNVSTGMEVAGQYTGQNPAEIFTIGDADKVWVLTDVFEVDIPRVKMGSSVIVDVPSWPGRDFTGKVDWISSALDPTTHATKVRCTFDNSDRALKPEMFATVKISVDVKKAIAIPRSSVIRLGEQLVVFLDRGPAPDGREKFERLPLIVDEGEGSKWLTVDHGLAIGDRIVTSGAVLLSDML